MKRQALWVGLLLFAGCNLDSVIQCVSDAIGASLSRALQVSVGEGLVDINRPDEVYRDESDAGAGELYMSGAHAGGRFVVRFKGPVVSGQLPRALADAGCTGDGDYAFFYARDGGTDAVSTTLAVLSDGGTHTVLTFSQLTLLGLPDGGSTGTLPDRTFDFVLP